MLRILSVTVVLIASCLGQDGFTRAMEAARLAIHQSRYAEAQKNLEGFGDCSKTAIGVHFNHRSGRNQHSL
jgi:hypothetical protein